MSLLLDALKKAAKDKQQATDQEGGDDRLSPEDNVAGEPASHTHEEIPELTLDAEEQDQEQAEVAPNSSQEPQNEEQELELEQAEVRGQTTTISDEALQMLVFKTNREHRRKQKIIWFSVTLTSVIILLVGGYYFYSEMVKDVEALERKHNIALQKVNAEVIKRKDPKLIAGLTSKPAEEVVQQPVKPSVEKVSKTEASASKPSKPAASRTNKNSSPIKVESSRKQDPVGELLNAGWLAYNEGKLDLAQQNYSNALKQEPANRDALLGVAAIATRQDNAALAIRTYQRLLELNPRDTVAAPALASLKQQTANSTELSGMDESSLKRLLKHDPAASNVSFALGNIKAGQGQWPQAQQYYFDAWQNSPDNADYAFNLAISLEHINKKQQAADFYRRSLELAKSGAFSFDTAIASSRLQMLGQ